VREIKGDGAKDRIGLDMPELRGLHNCRTQDPRTGNGFETLRLL
jgi:hypothetical protein